MLLGCCDATEAGHTDELEPEMKKKSADEHFSGRLILHLKQ